MIIFINLVKRTVVSRILRMKFIYSFIHKIKPLQLHDLVLVGAKISDSPMKLLEEIKNKKPASLEISSTYPNYYNANPKTLELLELLIARKKPLIVVETGIANGKSTRTILNSFQKYNLLSSSLFSFDIDINVVTEDLKSNSQFTFNLVSSKDSFKILINHLPPIDLFFHDSDHSFENQMMEYELVWEKLSKMVF